MIQTEEEKKWIVLTVVHTMFPEEDFFRCSYLGGYIQARLEKSLKRFQDLLSRQNCTFEEACQGAEITGQFQKELWSVFNQNQDIVWTEELVKSFIRTDISMEKLRPQADRSVKRILSRILSEKDDSEKV